MPDLSELDAAMMQPGFSVPAVRRLGGGMIRLNDQARPLRTEGRDAVIYELRTPSGRIVALRALHRPVGRRDRVLAQRYAALRDDARLESLRGSSGALPRDVQWIDEGVALPGQDLQRITVPLVTMERVPGRTLARTIDRLCREGETQPIALLADRWLETAATLEAAAFVHGDLAADNVMVRPDGTIAVVDLDTAHWPSSPLPPPPAGGTPGYVHPRGAPGDVQQRDRFPAFILWASLRILARHPELRERWGDHPDRYGATLLWSHDDLRRPERSPLFARLDALDDEALQPLLEIVRRAIRFSAAETPPLAEIAERLADRGLPRWATSGQPGRRDAMPPPRVSTPAVDEGGALFGDPNRLWAEDAASPPSPHGDATGRTARAGRTTTIVERDRRRAAAQQLAAAIASRDTKEATRLWRDARTIPEAAAHAADLHSLICQEADTVIDRAIRRRDDAALVAAAADAERSGVPLSAEVRVALRNAQHRLSARAELQMATMRGDFAAIADLERSGKLASLGRLEPALSRTIERAVAWPALERSIASDDDVAIAAAFDPTLWLDEGSLPEAARERVDLAQRRLRWVEDARAALRKRDGPALRDLLTGAPAGAEQRLTEVESRRMLRVTMREAAIARLERALRHGPDREIVAALAEFESAGAPFSEVLDWAAVRGVVDRITLAESLRATATSDPPDSALLARLLPAARAALGDGSVPGGPDWAALEQTVLRAAHLARLREAIASGDDARMASAADPDPYGATDLLTAEERDRLARAMASTSRRPV